MSDPVKMAEEIEERQLRQIELFNWAPEKRGMSKELARSALFAAVDKRQERRMFHDHEIVCLEGVRITYSGQELRQDDCDVYLQLCHVARGNNFGTPVKVTGRQLLDLLDWGRKPEDYARLAQCLKRIFGSTLFIDLQGRGKVVRGRHLMDELDINIEPGKEESDPATKWTVSLNPQMANIMSGNHVTLIDWAHHCKLGPLAKWLYRYYATHEAPYANTPKLLRELCGSQSKNLTSFRQGLRRALDSLVSIGFITYDYDKERDLIQVQRVKEPNPDLITR